MAKQEHTNPKAPKSAKPGTADATAKKVERIAYVVPEGGLAAIPTDYSAKIHKPLQRKDFKEEYVWFEMRAQAAERTAKKMRSFAEDAKKLGNVKDRAKAKRLIQMTKRMAELTEQLKSQGIDVAALLASAPAATAVEDEAPVTV